LLQGLLASSIVLILLSATSIKCCNSVPVNLTKREYFAGLALQGLCANDMSIDAEEAVRLSVQMADDLIKELEKF